MPSLVRYVGPLAAYRGAIGFAADGGAMIGGRVRLGDVAPAAYKVKRDGLVLAYRTTWVDACVALAHATGEQVDRSPPDPAGLEVIVGEHVYRLEVV